MILADFCNRPTARAPEQPLDSHAGERFAAPSAQVEARLTPCLQLRSRVDALLAEEEHPTGGVLRCGGVINRSQRSKPDL
jgi:hypothetical protein